MGAGLVLVYKRPGVNNRIGEDLGTIGRRCAVGEEDLLQIYEALILVELNADRTVRGRRDPKQNKLRERKE